MATRITNEMLQGMTADQLKTLRKNAELRGDTPAAREVLELLSQSGLLTTPAAAPKARKPTSTSAKPRQRSRPAAATAPKVKVAAHGRQA